MTRLRRSPKVQKVQIVKKKRRKRRGPKITPLVKNRTVAKLRYVDTISINAGSAAIASHVFRANGLFDCDVTGTGHQPHGFDQHTLLYSNYRVISSTIKVSPIAVSVSNLVPALYGVYRDKDSTLSYTLGTAVIEDKRNKGSWGLTSGITTSKFSNGNLTQKTASFRGSRDLGPEERNASQLTSADPSGSEDVFYMIWAASVLGNDPGAQAFMVQLDYVVEFTQPIFLAQS